MIETDGASNPFYCCSSFLLVKACQFLPTKRQISLCACLLMRVFVCHCSLSLFCVSFTRSLLLLFILLQSNTAELLSNVRKVHLLLHGLQKGEAPPHFCLRTLTHLRSSMENKELWQLPISKNPQQNCNLCFGTHTVILHHITGGLFDKYSLNCCILYNVVYLSIKLQNKRMSKGLMKSCLAGLFAKRGYISVQ